MAAVGAVSPELLRLSEAVSTTGPIDKDGLAPLVIIRPGVGRGKGRHLYEAAMLQREVAQGRFKGWPMYIDHESPEAKRRAGGLPRSMRDLGGVVKEAWWDPNYSEPTDAESGRGRGAVLGLGKPNRFMRGLIEDIPEAVGISISATATGVQPVNRGGQTVWLVEAINPTGSVDYVTRAGAGGKVITLMEHLIEEGIVDEEEEGLEMLEALTDEAVIEHLRAERPDLLVQIQEAADDGDGDDDAKELQQLIAKHMKKQGGDVKKARAAAMKEMRSVREALGGGDDMAVAPEDLREALVELVESDEGKGMVRDIVVEQFRAVVAPHLEELVEAALEDHLEVARAEADAGARRLLEVRDLRGLAHGRIEEQKWLPESMKRELRERFEIVGTKPTADLDVVEDVDDAGKQTKSAQAKLTEAVDAAIAVKREQLAEIDPTRVRGQGQTAGKGKTETAEKEGEVEEGANGAKPQPAAGTTGSDATDSLLVEAGFEKDELVSIYDDDPKSLRG